MPQMLLLCKKLPKHLRIPLLGLAVKDLEPAIVVPHGPVNAVAHCCTGGRFEVKQPSCVVRLLHGAAELV